MNSTSFNVLPLFPTPLIHYINDEYCSSVEELFEKFSDDWIEVNLWSSIAKNKFVLNSDEKLRDEFTGMINGLIRSLMKISHNIELQITTSWFTKTPPMQRGNPHTHTNSWWSGVYYFRDDTSAIKFEQYDTGVYIPHEGEANEFNSSAFTLEPEIGTLILFPSKLIHSIQLNDTNTNRHSLAFNIMPKGKVGNTDSYYEYT